MLDLLTNAHIKAEGSVVMWNFISGHQTMRSPPINYRKHIYAVEVETVLYRTSETKSFTLLRRVSMP